MVVMMVVMVVMMMVVMMMLMMMVVVVMVVMMAGVGLPASILQLRLAASPSTTTSTSAGTVEITGFTEKYHSTVREFGMVVRQSGRLKAFTVKKISTRVK